MSADCIFCKIAAGQIPSNSVYEDEDVIAFHDIRPLAKIHFLIVPKTHIETLNDCTAAHEALLGKMMVLAPTLAAGLGLTGYKTVMNVGREGGQEVFHIHLHVFGGGAISG
ncbi:histidine triad nucleotide-binding protein [Methylophilus medardicus]|uniref:Histidine triad nucleotide-binding protein n=1 Tax=Methylophilus medardicus TaxID=2588534 RepID=A0A5B8CQ02_9PROT|nr:histidine triad nucleotide-binding protein [Methylophilus medardicus]QDC43334.1 histidine triad nucleotide-binding protein [Methylophilus medardicus]QDC48341.1 histidine triad nucleotide-binding protein [Methylophilus medardicus]QDC52046.1 histidine triad nucleotide-binding protein [Methylophilus medardicus]